MDHFWPKSLNIWWPVVNYLPETVDDWRNLGKLKEILWYISTDERYKFGRALSLKIYRKSTPLGLQENKQTHLIPCQISKEKTLSFKIFLNNFCLPLLFCVIQIMILVWVAVWFFISTFFIANSPVALQWLRFKNYRMKCTGSYIFL